MTVTELLTRIMAAYAGATPEAMKTFVPVFHARLKRHEGVALDEAAIEVLGSFKPKFDQKFPIPADFEKHLPSGNLKLPEEGASIRGALNEREARKRRVYTAWLEGQGAKIRENRPWPVYAAAARQAFSMAGGCGDRLLFSPEQIKTLEARALSTARVQMFGALPKTEAAWLDQIEQVRQAWANPMPREQAA
jgi:hypothetical protein